WWVGLRAKIERAEPGDGLAGVRTEDDQRGVIAGHVERVLRLVVATDHHSPLGRHTAPPGLALARGGAERAGCVEFPLAQMRDIGPGYGVAAGPVVLDGHVPAVANLEPGTGRPRQPLHRAAGDRA